MLWESIKKGAINLAWLNCFRDHYYKFVAAANKRPGVLACRAITLAAFRLVIRQPLSTQTKFKNLLEKTK